MFRRVCILIYFQQLFFSILANNYFINWSIATDRVLGRKERNIQYLGYKKDTVLDCDLLEGICDINCCIDKDCTQDQINLFSCSAAKEQSYLDICGLQEDLAPFFECVNSNSPYIGEFYINKKKIQKIDVLKDEIKMQRKEHYNYAQDQHYNTMQNNGRGYKYGFPLRTVSSNVDNNIVPRRIENLKLPDNVLQVFDGVCSDNSIFFLVNRNSRCIRQISKILCEQSTNFFLSKYLVFDASSNVSSKYSFPQLLSNVSGLHPVQTSVKYICLNNGSSYITILQNNFKKMTIHPKMFVGDNHDIDECEGEVETLMKTFYNDTSDMCHNVLVEVYYTFIWNGSNILKMEANYLLAAVPSVYRSSDLDNEAEKSQKKDDSLPHSPPNIGMPTIYVSQKFHVQFIHTEQITVQNETRKEPPFIRSGKPGYNTGSDIFIIDLVHAENSSSSYEENVLQLWNTVGKSGGCERTEPAPFGFDALASCRLLLTRGDFADCAELRERVSALQKGLLPGTWLASSGERANYDERPDLLVPIVRTSEEALRPPSTTRPPANATEEGDVEGEGEGEGLGGPRGPVACAVPAAWRMDVLYDKAPHTHWIVGARLTWEERVWRAPDEDEPRRYSLWSSVLFSRRLPPEPPLSRFWARVLSGEGAEWAWANAWRALRGPLAPADVGDVALALLLLAALGLAAAALRCL